MAWPACLLCASLEDAHLRISTGADARSSVASSAVHSVESGTLTFNLAIGSIKAYQGKSESFLHCWVCFSVHGKKWHETPNGAAKVCFPANPDLADILGAHNNRVTQQQQQQQQGRALVVVC